jgi:hypothetical protein
VWYKWWSLNFKLVNPSHFSFTAPLTHILLWLCDLVTLYEGSRKSNISVRCNTRWSHQHVLWKLSNFRLILESSGAEMLLVRFSTIPVIRLTSPCCVQLRASFAVNLVKVLLFWLVDGSYRLLNLLHISRLLLCYIPWNGIQPSNLWWELCNVISASLLENEMSAPKKIQLKFYCVCFLNYCFEYFFIGFNLFLRIIEKWVLKLTTQTAINRRIEKITFINFLIYTVHHTYMWS